MLELNKIHCGDCLELMKSIPDKSIDLTVTSPPYDNLRTYNDNIDKTRWEHIRKPVLEELYRMTKDWWVVVRVVWDATIKWSETGTSFKQALYAKDVWFNLHDTMIWQKQTFTAVWALASRYAPVFEYMFILSKWYTKTFNPIKDRENIEYWRKVARKKWIRKANWEVSENNDSKNNTGKTHPKFWQRFNIWKINVGKHVSSLDVDSFLHPATFPEKLAQDHILSWSNEWDTILDPFMWSWTTAKMAKLNKRNYIWLELSQEYVDIANKRLENTTVWMF